MNVTIVGCGARGALVAGLLASAGVQQLSLVDGAFVEEADAGAHPLQYKPDVGANKADALVAKLALINPDLLALPFPADLDASNAEAIITGADLAIDCSNDPEAAEALASACSALEIPLIPTPADYDPNSANIAQAATTATTQATQALSNETSP